MKKFIALALALCLIPGYAIESGDDGDIIAISSNLYWEDCFNDPLPVTPKTPNYTMPVNDKDGLKNIVLWREACAGYPSGAVVFMRVEIESSTNPGIWGGRFVIIQNDIQYSNIGLLKSIDPFFVFSGSLFISTTFGIIQASDAPRFITGDAFTLIYVNGDPISIEIPAYEFGGPKLDTDIIVTLEEPAHNSIVTGIGNLRGWAIGPEGISHVEYYIDGVLKKRIPYGGARKDINNAYPDYPDSEFPGFAASYAYGLQSLGIHTLTARAISKSGNYNEVTNTFEVTAFHKGYFPDPNAMDISSSSVSQDGTEILLNNIKVEGIPYDVRLEWQVPSQQFGIIDID